MNRFATSATAVLLCLSACSRTDQVASLRGLSYAEYKGMYGVTSIDPIGAHEIFHEVAKSPDGWEKWWRFDVTPTDFKAIAHLVAIQYHGPNPVKFESSAVVPKNWDAEASFPVWWFRTPHDLDNVHSAHWCVEAGAAERHHGWFFYYDGKTGRAWCWHWNHQWSSHECTSASEKHQMGQKASN